MKDHPASYSNPTKLFHWLSAILIIGIWVLGAVMTKLGDTPLQTTLYRTHIGIGLILLLITVIRVVWLFIDTHPKPLPMASWRRVVFVWNHRLLYIVIVLQLVSGLAMLLLSGLSIIPNTITPDLIQDVPPKNAHGILAKAFLLLFVMHVVGVLSYQFKEGQTLSRMGIGKVQSE